MISMSKSVLYIVGIACLFAASIMFFTASRKQTMASLMAQARYAVIISEDTVSQTNQISGNVAIELARRIREESRIRVVGRKSVCIGRVFLLDKDFEQLAVVTVLKYPLLQFDVAQLDFKTQLELRTDLLGSLGLGVHVGHGREAPVSNGNTEAQ